MPVNSCHVDVDGGHPLLPVFPKEKKNTQKILNIDVQENLTGKKKSQSCCFTEPCTQLGFTKGLNCVLADISTHYYPSLRLL